MSLKYFSQQSKSHVSCQLSLQRAKHPEVNFCSLLSLPYEHNIFALTNGLARVFLRNTPVKFKMRYLQLIFGLAIISLLTKKKKKKKLMTIFDIHLPSAYYSDNQGIFDRNFLQKNEVVGLPSPSLPAAILKAASIGRLHYTLLWVTL